jgi:hypothetical protein
MQAHLSLESLEARRMLSRGVPLAPTDLIETHSSESAITLGWTDNASNETGFRIERWNGRRWKAIGKVGANTTAFTNTPLNAGAVYAYRVFAFNKAGSSHSAAFVGDAVTLQLGSVAGGNSGITSTGGTKQIGNILPPTPVAATVLSVSHTLVQFTDNATNEDGYNVQASADDGPWMSAGMVGGTVGTGPRIFDFTSAKPGHTYAFRVAGFNSTGLFGYSKPIATSVAISGAKPAVLPSGKYFTLFTKDTSNALPEHSVLAQRMNADGSVDTNFTPQALEMGYPAVGKILSGMPNGNILVETYRENIMGNTGGQWPASLVLLGENGLIRKTEVSRNAGFANGPPMVNVAVGSDNKILVSTLYRGQFGLNNDSFTSVSQFNSDLTDTPLGCASGPTLPDSLTELPDGFGVASFGDYLAIVSSEGLDPLNLHAPASITIAATATGNHIAIADSGINETGVLVTRTLYNVGSAIDLAHQIIIGTIVSTGKPQTLIFDDSTDSPRLYTYLAYPLNGKWIGTAVRQ